MKFKDLGLSEAILKAIEEKGYSTPTAIQMQSIPVILEGHDLLAASQTGTGKTAGFTLPLLERLLSFSKKREAKSVRCLILTPTRELAMQVEESIKTYSKYLTLKSTVVFGGVNINPQMNRLKLGIDILVATPGRLLDLINQKAVHLSHVEMLVLDEADRMLDMGFINDIRKLLALLPKTRQNLLFSATFSGEIKKLAESLLNQPKMIQATSSNSTAEGVAQTIHPVDSKKKKDLLSFLISSETWKQVLVFTRTKHGANRLTSQLEEDGISAAAIHSNKSQNARVKALEGFKEGTVRVLVATDIAARGLDINELPYVVNYDLPFVAEDYVHRIGRTGRAGKQGKAVSLVSIDEEKLLTAIERLLKKDLPKVIVPNYEPDPSIAAKPLVQGRNSRFQAPREGSRFPSQRSRFSSQKEGSRFSSPKEESNFSGERERPRFSSSKEGSKFSSQRERPRFSSQKEGSKFSSEREKPRFSSQKEGSRFSSPKEGFKFSSERERPRFSSAKENPRLSYPKEGSKFPLEKEGSRRPFQSSRENDQKKFFSKKK